MNLLKVSPLLAVVFCAAVLADPEPHRKEQEHVEWSEEQLEAPGGTVRLVEPQRGVIPSEHKYDSYYHVQNKYRLAQQNKILQNVLSPAYIGRERIIDYRYLKTGGRDYVQGFGGQYLILPKGVKSDEVNKFKNFDEFLDHLKREEEHLLAEQEHHGPHRYTEEEEEQGYKRPYAPKSPYVPRDQHSIHEPYVPRVHQSHVTKAPRLPERHRESHAHKHKYVPEEYTETQGHKPKHGLEENTEIRGHKHGQKHAPEIVEINKHKGYGLRVEEAEYTPQNRGGEYSLRESVSGYLTPESVSHWTLG